MKRQLPKSLTVVIQPQSTRLIKPNFCFNLPPTQHHGFFEKLESISIKLCLIVLKCKITSLLPLKCILSDFMPVKYDVIVFIKNNVPLRNSSCQGFGFWFSFEFVPQKLRSNRSLVHPFASILLGDFLVCI